MYTVTPLESQKCIVTLNSHSSRGYPRKYRINLKVMFHLHSKGNRFFLFDLTGTQVDDLFSLFVIASVKDLSSHNNGFEKASNHSSFKTRVSIVLRLQNHGINTRQIFYSKPTAFVLSITKQKQLVNRKIKSTKCNEAY